MPGNTPFNREFLSQLQRLKIRTRRNFLGSRQGLHTTNRKGQGMEFADYRGYVAGDDYRHIDWGLYGRSDRLYIREFREEQDLSVSILLDASGSMAVPELKFQFARDLALSLAYVSVFSGDTARIVPMKGAPMKGAPMKGAPVKGAATKGAPAGGRASEAPVPPSPALPRFRTARAVRAAMHKLNALQAEGEVQMGTSAVGALAREKHGGKCFLISDFFYPEEDLFAGLDAVRMRNFELSLLQVVSPFEIAPEFGEASELVDAESGELLELAWDAEMKASYSSFLSSHLERLQLYCSRYGVSHHLLSCEEDLDRVIFHTLTASGLLRK